MKKPQIGSSPFDSTKIPLNTSSNKIINRAASSIDSSATGLSFLVNKNVSSNKKYKGIYFDPDVADTMEKTKSQQGVSFSFQVNQAMRAYLGL